MYVVWISEGKVRSDLHFSIRILSSSIRILSSIEDGRSPPLTREKHPQNKHDKPATWVIAWYPFLRIYVLLQLYLKDHPNEVIFCFFFGGGGDFFSVSWDQILLEASQPQPLPFIVASWTQQDPIALTLGIPESPWLKDLIVSTEAEGCFREDPKA